LVDGETPGAAAMGKCIGTIAWYSPGVDEHFVVFDDGMSTIIALF
jgi:hypothetical protein